NVQTLVASSVAVFGLLSSRSEAWTLALKMVTVHCSPGTKFTFGVMTCTAPLLVVANVASLCWPLAQVMSNQLPTTSTGSLKVMVMLESFGAIEAPAAGSTLTTNGPISWIGVVRRGFGVPVTKSLPLTSVSVRPPFLRRSEVVLLGAGALVLPSWQVAAP